MKNNKGFSLVELLVAIAISTIVMGTITFIIAYSSNSSRITNAKVHYKMKPKMLSII